MPKFEQHIFICGNQRESGHPRGCCDPEGQKELKDAFARALDWRLDLPRDRERGHDA